MRLYNLEESKASLENEQGIVQTPKDKELNDDKEQVPRHNSFTFELKAIS